jgi:hypothetical protein
MQVARRSRSRGGGVDHLQLVKGIGRFESRPAGYSGCVAQYRTTVSVRGNSLPEAFTSCSPATLGRRRACILQ